jgi:hypothetical protein
LHSPHRSSGDFFDALLRIKDAVREILEEEGDGAPLSD